MDGVITMFSQNEIMLMIGVVSVLLICITILTILDIKDYLKAKKNNLNEDLANEYEEEEIIKEPVEVMEVDTKDDLVIETKQEKKEEAYFEEMEDEQFEEDKITNSIIEEEEEYIPDMVQESKVELPKVEVNKEKKVLDAFEEIDDIDNLPNKKDDVTNFEMEQERTAIISLDELMKKSDELYNDNEVMQYDDGNEPISIDEVIKMFKHDDKENDMIMEEKELPKEYHNVVEEKVPYSKKETIPFISSVYGIEKDNQALEFENTATYEKLDRENYQDFVAQLKEMNENK